MKSGDYLQNKFQAWAQRRGIQLQGSEAARGKPNYTLALRENLYEELTKEACEEYGGAAGGELTPNAYGICSMQALHSSSAMAVNLFHYWKRQRLFMEVAQSLDVPSAGITSLTFERKYPVIANHESYGFREPPHLDLGIDYKNDQFRIGVECKLFEPYRNNKHEKLKKPYLELQSAWNDIPQCRELAAQLARGDAIFHRLGPAQLLRHILGLKYGIRKDQFRLIYLYLDAPGDEASEHRAEIKKFQDMTDADGICFAPITVREFILRMNTLHSSKHSRYIDYLTERYV